MVCLDEPVLQRVDRVWSSFVHSGRIVGGVLLLAQDGELRYASARGWANREQRLPMQRETRFRLASLTKLLTSVTTLRLCEQGALHLGAPVTEWLPWFTPPLADGRRPVISLRQLLSHTAGLGYGFEQPAGNAYQLAGVSDGLDQVSFGLSENLKRLARLPLLFEPGTAWSYSLASDVLGAVIEQATDTSLAANVARWVTGPLGMNATRFHGEPGEMLAVAYKDGPHHPVPINAHDLLALEKGCAQVSCDRVTDASQYVSGGAGMLGCADDYLTLLECLRLGGAAVLNKRSTDLLLGNAIAVVQMKSRGPGWKFGLGPAVLADPQAAGQPQGAGTWSWCGIYGSHYWVDPQARISLVAMTNTAVAGAWGAFADSLVRVIYSGAR